MPQSELIDQIAQKDSDKEEIAGKVIEQPGLLAEIFEGLNADTARIRYGCEKVLRIISEKKPEVLYPRIDFFINNLDNDNNILRWGAIHVLANLAAVDSDDKLEKNFNRYFSPIPGPELIPAGNVITGAAKIALAKPELTDKITYEILKVEKAVYKTTECRNIALGHAINSFAQFFTQIQNKDQVIELIKKQLKNTRNGTRKKAEKFVKKYKI